MVIAIDNEGRADSDEWESDRKSLVLVDMREFRAALPFAIHRRNMRVIPCTLNVGDYILSPDIVIERKAVPDLIQSLKSGRLFSQCESMTRHYKTVIILIEFESERNFKLVADTDIFERLVLMIIHFPKIRILWTNGPDKSAALIHELKYDNPEPDMQVAMSFGDSQVIQSQATDILRALPGITFQNIKLIVEKVKNLRELSTLPLSTISGWIGDENGRILYNFFRADTKKKS